MNFPFFIQKPLDETSLATWEKVFLPSKGTKLDKTVEESLWRRTQSEKNKNVSGWNDENDKARKILYYRHEYDVLDADGNKQLALTSTYVYYSLTLMETQIKEYGEMIYSELKSGGWKETNRTQTKESFELGDLLMDICFYTNPEDRPFEYDTFPKGYQTIEIFVHSKNYIVTDKIQKMIWHIAKAGFRKSLPRTNPTYAKSIEEFIPYLPAQVEFGCGPSYEAGILPLHTLHEVYSINEPFTKKFIMTANEDTFIRDLVGKPKDSFNKTADFFYKIVTAPLTDFYKVLKRLHDKGLVVGPVITNNFDGLHLRLGFEELFIRTYDEVIVMPELQFDPRAKSLIVVGCHADRRSIELRARERGLKIMYIDPEGWHVDGDFFDYLLENAQTGDLIYKEGASQAFRELAESLEHKGLL